jgi:glycosyltransferase involved in cell wall biosynthesis
MSEAGRVLHIIDTGGPGGAETVFFNLVIGLEKLGWSSVAVVPNQDWLWGELVAHSFTPFLLPSRGAFDLRYLGGLAGIARRHRVDLIQTHLFGAAVYGTIAASLNGVPVVCTHHGQTDLATSGSYRQLKFHIVRRRRNHHVFVSGDLKQRFATPGIINGQNTRVIHNGVDCEQFHPQRNNSLRSELGMTADEILVGAVGNLRRPKDYPNFVRAAGELARRSPRYRFVLAGANDEPLRTELVGLIRAMGLSGRFTLLGFQSDVARILNSLDVYVLSSSTEGFSLTTVQAMACGLPVVATRCGGPEEIVVDGETGLLVPIGAPFDLADAIEKLCADDACRAAFAQAGRARAVAKFSIDAMLSSYAALYQECRAGARRGRQA